MSYTLYRQANFGTDKGGLATVGYTLYNAAGAAVGARVTDGIAERGTTTGIYGATVTFADAFVGEIRWDTGGASPVYASEEINPQTGEYLDAKISSRLTNTAWLQRNTAVSNFQFKMVSSADHVTGKTGLTVTAQRNLDGGAFAACANPVTEVGNGYYKLNLAAADLDAAIVVLRFTGTGADERSFMVVTHA